MPGTQADPMAGGYVPPIPAPPQPPKRDYINELNRGIETSSKQLGQGIWEMGQKRDSLDVYGQNGELDPTRRTMLMWLKSLWEAATR